MRPGQPTKSQRTHREAEIAQGDVVVARVGEQVDDDALQPQHHPIGEDVGLDTNEDPRDDLHYADAVYERYAFTSPVR